MTAATWRATPKAALRRLAATAGPAGVVIGRQHSGALSPVRLLRPQPTRAVIVGGYWAARLVVFRCLGIGALVEVTTASPARWAGLAESAGAAARFRVVPAGQYVEPWVTPSATLPLIQVNDAGGRGAEKPTLGPWHTSMTILPAVTAHTAPVLSDADVVLLQRLSAPEADVAVTALRLPTDALTKLTQIHDDMMVTIVVGEPRYIFIVTTPMENDLFGPPRRERDV